MTQKTLPAWYCRSCPADKSSFTSTATSSRTRRWGTVSVILLVVGMGCTAPTPRADIILWNGKVITVDESSPVAEAVAIRKGKFLAVGTNTDILKLKGDSTQTIDLKGRSVIPGLNEGHAHPLLASQSEYTEKIPDLHTIRELLDWIKAETANKKKGEWIIHPKFFITRLNDMRQVTKGELDAAAPNHPVFLNGSFGGFVNTRALQVSGMTALKHPGILRDEKTGEALGVIRGSAFPLLAIPKENGLTEEQQVSALKTLFLRYNEVGITSVCSGGGPVEELKMMEKLKARGELTVRIFQNILLPVDRKSSPEAMREALAQFGYKTGDGDEWVKVGALKVILDGGVLTGTAFLREGWGKKALAVYGIADPNYRGELFYSKAELIQIITLADEAKWKFTAHVTGGGGVDTLLAALETVNRSRPIKEKRFSIIHGNFFTPEAIQKMAELGIYADMQPAWFYKDTDLLLLVLGKDRINTFHPYHSMMEAGITINGGSDHMVKLDPNTSVNPYNPFLAMEAVVTRKTDRGSIFNHEQAISREQALKMYTLNNAFASFEEAIKGSVETGKLADLAVLTDDLLTCPENKIHEIKSLLTFVNGQIVFNSGVLIPSKE